MGADLLSALAVSPRNHKCDTVNASRLVVQIPGSICRNLKSELLLEPTGNHVHYRNSTSSSPDILVSKVWRLRDSIVIDGAKHFGHFQERKIDGLNEIDWADNTNCLVVIDQNTKVNRRHCKYKQDVSSKKLKRTKCLVMNDHNILARLL